MACQFLDTYIPLSPLPLVLDFVRFYQSPNKTSRPGKGHSIASYFEILDISKERDNPVAYERSSSQSGRLKDYDLIKYIDLTTSSSEDTFHLSLALVLDPKGAESYAGCARATKDLDDIFLPSLT